MPQLRFPKRDVEAIPPAVRDNDSSTVYTLFPNDTLTVFYSTPKTVYTIILLFNRLYYYDEQGNRVSVSTSYANVSLNVTTDGTNFFPAEKVRKYSGRLSIGSTDKVFCWWINQSIKGWKIINSTGYYIDISEIIVLVPDETKPFLPVFCPDSIELLSNGTTNNLDSFSNLLNICDGDDNTYATFTFRGGYSEYTLYLRGSFSIPMATVISPFALIEIDPLASNLASVIDIGGPGDFISSHGFFHWGTRDAIPGMNSSQFLPYPPISRISNTPRLLWSQKAREETTIVDNISVIRGVFSDSILQPDSVDPFGSTIVKTAMLAPLNPASTINTKTLYAPYFFSLMYCPIFVAGDPSDYIYFATDTLAEPFVYTAANGTTGKITLHFGLRIITTSIVSNPFAVKLYSMGFLCFPQMDFEAPLTFPTNVAWFDHVPQGNVTRDNNELTESTDITTAEKFVMIYPTAVDVLSAGGRMIRFRIRSTSGGDSNFTIKRYYGFHRASDNTILWYSQDATYNVGATLQSFDVVGEDQYGQTKVIKVEIIPI